MIISSAIAARLTRKAATMSDVAPVTASERFVSLDMLRGVAVLGILVMNIYAFAMPFSAYMNPLLLGGTEPHNLGTWFFTHIFFDQKFLSIFAMMFGAGIVLMSGRAEAKGAKPAPILYRRQFWLVVIGCIHAYLVWWGDILFSYAMVGMLVYVFRKRQPKTLIIIACVLLPVNLVLNYGTSSYMEQLRAQAGAVAELQAAGETLTEEQGQTVQQWQEMRVMMAPTAEDMQEDLETHRGSYVDIVSYRVPLLVTMQLFGLFFFGIWRIGGLMLIGMALMKLGVLTGERSTSFYRKLMIAGYAIGLPLVLFSSFNAWQHEFDGLHMMRFGLIPNYFGSIAMALGHVGLVMLAAKSGWMKRLMARFAAVGRMALTNYLMHSVILTTVFYGYGLGLYGQIPRLWQMAFVVAVLALQLWISPLWLRRYRFGPVEWLWRSLSYWRRQPMRLTEQVSR
jgi:uncharacterized protein